MKKLLLSLATGLAVMQTLPAAAQTNDGLIYSQYKEGVNEIGGMGIAAEGIFDIAMYIPGYLEGARITKIQIPFASNQGLSDIRGWVSKSLNGTETVPFAADIESKALTVTNTQFDFTDVVFEKEVTVPSEGLYVGYTFTVLNVSVNNEAYPIVCCRPTLIPGANLYIKYTGLGGQTKKNLEWGDQSEGGSIAPAINVYLTDIKGDQLIVNPVNLPTRMLANSPKLPITVSNAGTNGIESLEYEFTCNGSTKTNTVTFKNSDPIAKAQTHYGMASASLDMDVSDIDTQGNYPFEFKVTKVNGKAVDLKLGSLSNMLKLYDKFPDKLTVIEENTCTKCPNCPKGWYGMKVMSRLYGEEFIGISYHNNEQGSDPMTVMNDIPYDKAAGNPDAYADRLYNWYDVGTSEKRTAGMEKLWTLGKSQIAPAHVSVKAEWTDPEQTTLRCTATANFPVEEECGYLFDIALIHDGMTGTNSLWKQSNTFSGWPEEMYSEPEWQYLVNESNPIRGMVFDDIFVGGASVDMRGATGSLPTPENIQPGKEYTFTHDFVIDNLRNTSKAKIVQDKTRLRVVALLLDTERNVIVNAAHVKTPGYSYSGIGSIEPDGNASNMEAEAYYDLTGRRVDNPSNGIYIVTLKNGRTEKRVIK